MKKFLLSLLCLISFMVINANEVAFVADGATYNGSAPTVTIANGADGNIVGLSFTNKDITITHTKIQSNKSNVNSGAVRWYQSDLLTFTPASGITITKIEAIIASGSKGVFAAQVGTVTGDGTTVGSSVTWEGSTTEELILTASKQVRFTYLIVTYTTSGGGEVVETVAKPTFSVASGVFTEPFDLTLSAAEGNTIYYTLDGSNPTVDSDIYDGEAIRISEYTEVKATAVNAQGVASNVATATYAFQNTENTAMTVAEALAWIEEGKDATTEQYIAGYITAIENVNLQYGNAEYSIADAIDGTDVLLVYRGNYLNGDKFTAEDQIKVGDKVLIYGKLKDYNGTPEVDSYSRIVSFLEKAPDEGGEEPGDDPVVPENPETATVVTFDFTAPSSLNPVQDTPEFGQQNSIIVNDVVFTAGNVSLSFDKGSASTDCRIWAGTSAYDLRTYSNSTMTFTVTGAAITSIVFTGDVSSSKMTSEEGTFTEKTWVGDSQSVVFTATANIKINTITVTYDTATGIEDTMVDENAPVEYYNLQGVKVANPENGIFIKKQGAKATKVVL